MILLVLRDFFCNQYVNHYYDMLFPSLCHPDFMVVLFF